MFSGIRDGDEYKLLIAGTWRKSSSGTTTELRSPEDGSVVGKTQNATREEIDEAFSAAAAAQKGWAALPAWQRAEVLMKAARLVRERKDELADMLVREIAKPRKLAEDEVLRTAELIEFTAEEGKRISGELVRGDAMPGTGKKIALVERVPLGTILCISPFNYPINLAAAKIAPALVAGNAVVFKPSTQGAISGLHLAEIFRAAGVPNGVLAAVTGRGSEIGDYLVKHPKTSAVYFTGGTETGRRLAEAAGMIPLLLELGGKDAAIVLPDADPEEAAKAIVSGAFSYSGQRCTAVKRVLLVDSPGADAVVSKIAEQARKLKVGRAADSADITSLIDRRAADNVWSIAEEAKAKGATVLTELKREGNLIHPAVFDRVPLDSRLAWEEPFGPLLPIIRVKNEEEAVMISNRSEYGLQASVFTRDLDAAMRISGRLDVGTVQVNGKPSRGPDNFPFVGAKSSGVGTQGIRYSIEGMTRIKSVVLNIGSGQ